MLQDCEVDRSFFFSNRNILSLLLTTSPEIDYLHHQIMKHIPVAGKLEIDSLVLEMVQLVTARITDIPVGGPISSSLRKNHLGTIERAKDYMNEHFVDDLSLKELASHCNVSLFHFCRTFKQFTSYSPHQYLLNIRLKHAEMLLRNSSRPVTDICFSSGFNSMEHFATMFKQKNKLNPTRYRRK